MQILRNYMHQFFSGKFPAELGVISRAPCINSELTVAYPCKQAADRFVDKRCIANIAVFYSGLGSSLFLAGILFWFNCQNYHTLLKAQQEKSNS